VACSSEGGRLGPEPTVGPDVMRSTTTAPYAVPAVIDAAYVNRVIAGLDAITGDVVRMVVQSKTIPREAFDRLKAIYANDNAVNRELDGYSKDLSRGLVGYRDNPGNKRTSVKELITVSGSCIYVSVERDYSPAGNNGPTNSKEWIALRPLDPNRDPQRYNITGWAYIYEGFSEQGTQPIQNPCFA
jgi:hypothetical protein